MAFSGTKRKEVKKSSYYVWFLGAKESGGLRGEEYIRPALRYLTERENEVEPLKVTLQVSTKGLKIIQNISWNQGSSKAKSETLKHFIPDHSITCVTTDSKPNDDVVACILLIYNPASKCPVHVHAYRCDTVETATLLREHLQSLVDRPENQRKFVELERRLQAKGLLPTSVSSRRLNSDGRSTQTTESDSSGGSSDKDIYALDERMSGLYDSLAAELREKLNNKKNHGPLLLPPRDYDTIHRVKGKVEDIDHGGRSQPMKSVTNGPSLKRTSSSGVNRGIKDGMTAMRANGQGFGAEPDSSGKSSGIGSDEAPSSPTHERGRSNGDYEAMPKQPLPPPKKHLHDDSSSDEEWSKHRDPQATSEREMILVRSPRQPRRSVVGGRGRSMLRSTEDLRRSPSPPSSSMRPPSPKPPPFRERYHETRGSTADFRSSLDRNGNTVSRDTSTGSRLMEERHRHGGVGGGGGGGGPREMDRSSRTMPHRNAQYDGPPKEKSLLRRVKSREDKDHLPYSERDTGYGSRSDRDPFGSRDLLDREPSHQHSKLSHSRSQDHLRSSPEIPRIRRENSHHGPRYRENNEDSWTTPSDHYNPRDFGLRAKSPAINAKSTSTPDHSPSYRDAYVPLPRIRRLDQGQSSASHNNNHHPDNSHHHHSHRNSAPSSAATYQELPKEKRYPGLDRDTARFQQQQQQSGKSSSHQGKKKWEFGGGGGSEDHHFRDSRLEWDSQDLPEIRGGGGGGGHHHHSQVSTVLRRMESGSSGGSNHQVTPTGRPGASGQQQDPSELYAKTTRSTNRHHADKMDKSTPPSFSSSTSSQGIHKRPTYYFDSPTDDPRFYRYSSSDADYRTTIDGGRRKTPPDGYHY